MPAAVDLEARIVELVAARRAELLQLVDAALESQLVALVDERIAERNGSSSPRPPGPATAVADNGSVPPGAVELAPARVCASCGQRPAAQGRTVCHSCRERERRRRRAAAAAAGDVDGPRSGPNLQTG